MKRLVLFAVSWISLGFTHAQRGSRDMPNPFPEEQGITIIGIQETIEQSPSSVTFTFNHIQINPAYRVWHIKTVPIIPWKAEPTIYTVPPCLVNCPPPPIYFRTCRGTILLFIDGIKIRGTGAKEPKEKTCANPSPFLTGFPADIAPTPIPYSLTSLYPFNTRH